MKEEGKGGGERGRGKEEGEGGGERRRERSKITKITKNRGKAEKKRKSLPL